MKISSTNQQLMIAYLNTLTFSCVQILLYTTIPYISEQTTLQTATIIGSISVGSFIFAFMGPFWASKSDTWGRKRVLSFGMLGMFFSFLLLSSLFVFNTQLTLTAKIAIIYISRIIYGLLASAVVPVSQAWQLDLIDTKDKLKVLTRNSMCLNVGRILGPIVILVKQVDFEHIIYFGTGWVFCLAMGCLLTSTPSKKFAATMPIVEKVEAPEYEWKSLLKEAMLPIFLALIFTSFIGVLHSTLGHHLKVTFNIRGDEASVLMAKIVLGSSLFALVVQQSSQWIFKREWKLRLITGASTLILGSFILSSALTMRGIWSALMFISIGLALIPPVYLALISHSSATANVTGKKIGMASISHSLGYALGAGMIALSMKMNIVSNMTVISFISVTTFIIVASLIFSKTDFVLPAKKDAQYTS